MTDNKKIDKIEDEIDTINQHLAQCRMIDQKNDHDKLIQLDSTIKVTNDDIKNFKQENIRQHKELKDDRIALADKLEQVSGNLNQGMMYIKNLQNGAKVRVGITTAIISGVIATIIATLIIYIGTLAFDNLKQNQIDATSKQLLLEISNKLNQNSNQIRKFESTISKEIKNEGK